MASEHIDRPDGDAIRGLAEVIGNLMVDIAGFIATHRLRLDALEDLLVEKGILLQDEIDDAAGRTDPDRVQTMAREVGEILSRRLAPRPERATPPDQPA